MAKIDQMLGTEQPGAAVIRQHARALKLREMPVDQHEWHVLALQVLVELGLLGRRREATISPSARLPSSMSTSRRSRCGSAAELHRMSV
ncbi:MAG: hypothetical protein R2724_32760 [Bryobacterales bacterium]